MIQKQKAETMITAEEVVEIFRRAGTVESLQRARDIEQAYIKLNNIENEPDLTCILPVASCNYVVVICICAFCAFSM